MSRSNIECYVTSLSIIKNLLQKNIISHEDFIVAESYLAKKYCIKNGSLYRPNDLINSSKRVINGVPKKEVNDNGKECTDNRCITKVEKKT